MVKDYNCKLHYHPRKENVVADDLSRKVTSQVVALTVQELLWKDFDRLNLEVVTTLPSAIIQMIAFSIQPTLCGRIKDH